MYLIYHRTIVLFIDFFFYLAITIFYSTTNKLKTLVDNRGIKNLATFEKERLAQNFDLTAADNKSTIYSFCHFLTY